MRSMLIASLFTLGCAAGGAESEASFASVGQAPPPFLPELNIDPIVTGRDISLSVDGVPPGSNIFVLQSNAGPGAGPCHPTVPVCASILVPSVLVRGSADPSGSFQATIAPPPAMGAASWWQVAVFAPNGNRISDVVLKVRDDSDGDFHVDSRDTCPNIPNPVQIDDDLDGFGLECDCNDLDPLTFPGAPDSIGDGIDQDCDGVDGQAGDPALFDGLYTGLFDLTVSFVLLPFDCVSDLEIVIDSAASPPLMGIAECPQFGILGPTEVLITATSVGPELELQVDALGVTMFVPATLEPVGTGFQLFAEMDDVVGISALGNVPIQFTIDATR